MNTSASSFTAKLNYQPDRRTVFFVFAINNAGRSPLSRFRSIPIRDMSIPSKPTDLRVLHISERFITLFWRHPLGEVRVSVSARSACFIVLVSDHSSILSQQTQLKGTVPIFTAKYSRKVFAVRKSWREEAYKAVTFV